MATAQYQSVWTQVNISRDIREQRLATTAHRCQCTGAPEILIKCHQTPLFLYFFLGGGGEWESGSARQLLGRVTASITSLLSQHLWPWYIVEIDIALDSKSDWKIASKPTSEAVKFQNFLGASRLPCTHTLLFPYHFQNASNAADDYHGLTNLVGMGYAASMCIDFHASHRPMNTCIYMYIVKWKWGSIVSSFSFHKVATCVR